MKSLQYRTVGLANSVLCLDTVLHAAVITQQIKHRHYKPHT